MADGPKVSPGQGQGTGLIPPTPAEHKKMHRELGMRKIKKIRPNQLGLERINEVRRKKGLEPLPSSSARRPGEETS